MSEELPPAVVQARRHARASGLLYVSDTEPGIRRKRRGSHFHYLGSNGRPVTASRTLDRIRRLAIPPAYTDVWICREPRGHLQATGRDARQRKQYRYHPAWRETRDNGKFARMIEFGAQLPRLRKRLRQDLALPGLPKNKVLAAIVRLLDETLLRVGNEEYARSNKSYGLTTLRDRHVKFLSDGRAFFCFKGKSGRTQEVVLDDRRLVRIIRHCQQLPGQQLFQYVDDDGRRQPVDSGMVNDYLREAMGGNGEGFTAKDFRTWGGTLMAAIALAEHGSTENETEARKVIAGVMRTVGAKLGNTPAVARSSYVSPAVVEQYLDGRTIDDFRPRHLRVVGARDTGLDREEQALLSLLRSWRIRRARVAA
jgi:DNA topoisomerase I